MPTVGLDAIKAKREKIAAKLEELAAQEQAELDRQAAILGHALLTAMEHDQELAQRVTAVLDRTLKKKRDRALFDLPPRARKAASPQAAPTGETG
jgi:hypothetical protein